MKQGDFSALADDYARYRPGYADSVRDALARLAPSTSLAVDVGAGTGIWTRMLSAKFSKVIAVEPDDNMRAHGRAGGVAEWRKGTGENTGIEAEVADLVSMASSFHWVDFDRGTQEFHRLLKPGGIFVALWNPRLIEANPILVEIEHQLKVLCPTLKRVSSGRSGITDTLADRLDASPFFRDPIYLEAKHTVEQSVDHYIGAWRSVNDVQAQLGPDNFNKFLDFAAAKIGRSVTTTYLTRAWCARRD